MHESGGKANNVACILAHDLVNKITAIVCHCDILETKAADHGDVECREHLRKVRDLATGMALMLHRGECAVQAVNGILTLQNAFATELGKKFPRKCEEYSEPHDAPS